MSRWVEPSQGSFGATPITAERGRSSARPLAAALVVFGAVACTPPDTTPTGDATDGGDAVTDTDTDTDTPSTTGDTSTTSSTGDTSGTTTTEIDCTNLPTGGVQYTSMNIETTEDFDFDAEGMLVYAEWLGSNLIGVSAYGEFEIISGGIEDTRGISVLSTGDLAIAYIGQGRVGITDRATGSGTTLISSLSQPNALEVADGDVLYITEAGAGRVRRYDPATGQLATVESGFTYPNGLSLDEDHDTLYVSDSTSGIYRMNLQKDGTWSPKELVVDPAGGFGDTYDALEVDACGNVYVLGFYTGELYRFDPVTLEATLLVDIQDAGAFLWNAMHWGSGRDGWRRDILYVTDRNKVFAVEVGVMGRDQPVDLAP